ncbi:hypothetical protein V8E53_006138 [Lactarius tabidus]
MHTSMAPCTRGKHGTGNKAAVSTSADSLTNVVSKKKKGKGTKTHPYLPPLMIKKPHAEAMESEVIKVAAGKHALSPEEGPTTVEELGACALSRIRNLQSEQKLVCGKGSIEMNVSESSSFESEDNELVVQPTQTNKMSQKMAFERPSWPSTATESPLDVDIPCCTAPLTTSDSALPSVPPNNEPWPSQYRAGTHVCPEDSHQSANTDTTSEHSEHQQGTCTRSKRSQVPTPGLQGTITDSQQVAVAGSQHPQATASGFAVATPDISANCKHLRGAKVPWVWPEDTNLHSFGNGRICLTDQTPIV